MNMFILFHHCGQRDTVGKGTFLCVFKDDNLKTGVREARVSGAYLKFFWDYQKDNNYKNVISMFQLSYKPMDLTVTHGLKPQDPNQVTKKQFQGFNDIYLLLMWGEKLEYLEI